LTNQCDRMSQP